MTENNGGLSLKRTKEHIPVIKKTDEQRISDLEDRVFKLEKFIEIMNGNQANKTEKNAKAGKKDGK